jgi:hypothetical protein
MARLHFKYCTRPGLGSALGEPLCSSEAQSICRHYVVAREPRPSINRRLARRAARPIFSVETLGPTVDPREGARHFTPRAGGGGSQCSSSDIEVNEEWACPPERNSSRRSTVLRPDAARSRSRRPASPTNLGQDRMPPRLSSRPPYELQHNSSRRIPGLGALYKEPPD